MAPSGFEKVRKNPNGQKTSALESTTPFQGHYWQTTQLFGCLEAVLSAKTCGFGLIHQNANFTFFLLLLSPG
jgi:hypothetical protein